MDNNIVLRTKRYKGRRAHLGILKPGSAMSGKLLPPMSTSDPCTEFLTGRDMVTLLDLMKEYLQGLNL